MQNFNPLATKLMEETEGRTDRQTLAIQKFTIFLKNTLRLLSGAEKLVMLRT